MWRWRCCCCIAVRLAFFSLENIHGLKSQKTSTASKIKRGCVRPSAFSVFAYTYKSAVETIETYTLFVLLIAHSSAFFINYSSYTLNTKPVLTPPYIVPLEYRSSYFNNSSRYSELYITIYNLYLLVQIQSNVCIFIIIIKRGMLIVHVMCVCLQHTRMRSEHKLFLNKFNRNRTQGTNWLFIDNWRVKNWVLISLIVNSCANVAYGYARKLSPQVWLLLKNTAIVSYGVFLCDKIFIVLMPPSTKE